MKYTKRELASIAKRTSSFNEFIREIFGKTDGNSWRKGKALVEKFGINTSHYKVHKYTKEMLVEVVQKSETMAEVCRKLGLKRGGGSQSFITRRIKEFGIDCSHFKKRSFPKTKKLKWQEVLVKRKSGNRRSPYILKRCLMQFGRNYKCGADECVVSEQWLGIPITLQVHHIDGDCLNDEPENLMFVCPNCHTQTDNWCHKGRK